jgi:hypothetical protein
MIKDCTFQLVIEIDSIIKACFAKNKWSNLLQYGKLARLKLA